MTATAPRSQRYDGSRVLDAQLREAIKKQERLERQIADLRAGHNGRKPDHAGSADSAMDRLIEALADGMGSDDPDFAELLEAAVAERRELTGENYSIAQRYVARESRDQALRHPSRGTPAKYARLPASTDKVIGFRGDAIVRQEDALDAEVHALMQRDPSLSYHQALTQRLVERREGSRWDQ